MTEPKTDAELDLILAEHFEPRASLPDFEVWQAGDDLPDYWINDLVKSKETGFYYPIWKPRSFCTDPAMTVTLIQAIIADGKCVFIGETYLEVFSSDPGTSEPEIEIDRAGPIGRAVSEAYARAKGLL